MDVYSLDKKIGKGSFSSVYVGHNKQTGKRYAVKKIKMEDGKKMPKYISSEIEITKKLDNKNVIKLYDIFYKGNTIFLVIDYCHHMDIKSFFRDKKLSEDTVKFYMIQIKNGLKYLFKNNIIHRDLKPQNILLTRKNIIKIADFGFATYFKSENELSKTMCGSPLYMAPEIIKNKEYTINADLWSCGVILYELIYGFPPYVAITHPQLLDKIEKTKPKYMRYDKIAINKIHKINNKNQEPSEKCISLMKMLLEKNPNKRIGWNTFFNNDWFLIQPLPIKKILNNVTTSTVSLRPITENILIKKETIPNADNFKEKINIMSCPSTIPIEIKNKKDKRDRNSSLILVDYFSPPKDIISSDIFENEYIIL